MGDGEGFIVKWKSMVCMLGEGGRNGGVEYDLFRMEDLEK